ncbi:Protein NUCLEAR FUSION DEFECTIVE 4, partial [Bienertia sinuspersici]
MRRGTALQWLSLVGVIWLQSFNGTNSNFPAYSSQLKQLLSLSQLQLNNLALASDAGKLFGWFAGIAAIYLPLWLVLLIGSTLGLIGYGLQYLFLTHYITFLSYWHIFFLTVLAGNGICWINTVCYLVAIHNFPYHRQAAVGLTTSYLGLSAVIYTAAVGAFSTKPSKRAEVYMLFNALIPLIVSVITAPFVRYIDTGKPKKVEHGFFVVLMITIATGIYAVASSLGPLSSITITNSYGRILLWLLEEKCCINRERRVCDVTTDADEVELEDVENWVKDQDNDVENWVKDQDSDVVEGKEEIRAIENIGAKLMMKRLNFWLYFFIYITGATLGLVYLNNLGQIAESRGYLKTSSLVSLASAMTFFGRLLPSILDYAYSSMVPGPASILVSMVPMAASFFLLMINGSNLSLHVSTAIIGFSTGIITAISVSTTTELFGPKHFGVNHNIVVANIPLGSFLFGGLAAILYHKNGDGHGKCLGLQCYSTTFVVWGSLCSLGAFLALVLHFRTRKFYLH